MANPTTNYGFVLPTPTDLVTDLPADFDVALQGVDTRLKALQPGTTLGDIAYSSATANTNTRLPAGTSGQVLAISGGVPAWTTVSSGGLTLISTTTLTGASVTISSIPQTYVDLRLIIKNYRPATDGRGIEMRFNGDTASNYTTRFASEVSNFGMNRTSLSVGMYNDDTTGTGFSNFTMYDYANTGTVKMSELYALGNSQTTAGNFNLNMSLGIYNQTSAISSITLFPFSENFTAGTALLYGVK